MINKSQENFRKRQEIFSKKPGKVSKHFSAWSVATMRIYALNIYTVKNVLLKFLIFLQNNLAFDLSLVLNVISFLIAM